MREAVPLRVVGRVAQPEVRAQVDDRGAVRGEVRHDLRGRPVGERQEDRVRLGNRRIDVEAGPVEMDVRPADRLARATASDQPLDPHVRVARQESDELRADVPGGADDRHAYPGTARRPGAIEGATRERDGPAPRHGRDDGPGGRAHGRAGPLTGGSPGVVAVAGVLRPLNACMTRMTIHGKCIVMQARVPRASATQSRDATRRGRRAIPPSATNRALPCEVRRRCRAAGAGGRRGRRGGWRRCPVGRSLRTARRSCSWPGRRPRFGAGSRR